MTNAISHDELRAQLEPIFENREPGTFLMQTFVNDTDEFATKHVDIDIEKGNLTISPYVTEREEGPDVDAIGFETRSYTPPMQKPKITITPDDIQKRAPGGIIYVDAKTLNPSISKFLARQADYLDTKITRAEEYQVKQALIDGVVTIHDKDKKLIRTIDYKRDSTLNQALTGGNRWDQAGVDMLKTLRVERRKINALIEDVTVQTVILGTTLTDLFLKNDLVQKAVSKDWASRGELAFEMRENGAIWLGYVDGFDIWGYEKKVVNPETGTTEYLIPEKTFLIGATDARFTMLYGAVSTAELDGSMDITAADRKLVTRGNRDPAGSIVQLLSSPLAGMNQPDAYSGVQAMT